MDHTAKCRFLIASSAALALFVGPVCAVSAASAYLIELEKVTAADGAAQDNYGQAVAISGDTAVVGAPRHQVGGNTKQGAVYVLERNVGGANKWGAVKKLVASDGAQTSLFGYSVALRGDTIVVGAYGDGGINNPQGLGSVYIFERNAGGPNNWGEVKKLKAGTVAGSFGFSVAISENSNTVVVGASGGIIGTEIGDAYVFDRNLGGANNWGLVKRLLASDPSQFNNFGHSVSISGDTVVIGSPGAEAGPNSDQGAAYVFERNLGGANNWGEVKKLTSAEGAANDQFGISVSISGDTIVAGVYFDDVGSNADQGSAYIFERNQGGANNWGSLKQLTASDAQSQDYLGYCVAIDGDRIALGPNTTGVKFASFTYLATRPVYLFDRNEGGANNWGEFQRISPVEDQSADFFGRSVALSGSAVIAGSVLADIGANTNQGAAYIFDTVPGPNPAIKGGSVTVEQDRTFFGSVAVVSDDLTPPGDLTVTVSSAPAGITVNNIENFDGKIFAGVRPACAVAPGNYQLVLQVADGGSSTATASLTVVVTPNTAPTLGDYVSATVGLTGNGTIAASAPPSDSVGLFSFNVTASAPGFTGSFAVDKFTGTVSFFNAGPAGNHTVTVTATDTCGSSSSKTFTLTVLAQGNTITVNTAADTVADDGTCSLREAITSANTHTASGATSGECNAGLTGTDLIAFNISGTGPHVIAPASPLPDITEPLVVDGLTQPGAVGTVWPPTLQIVLNGGAAGAGTNGLRVLASNSLVRGLVINQFNGSGIFARGNSNVIEGNFIGTNTIGTMPMGNGVGVSVSIPGGTGPGNLVGGTVPGARNLISGNNGPGISFDGNGSTSPDRAEGNFIGTDVTGTLDLGNTGDGVRVQGLSSTVGGLTPGAGNLISGNDQNGVFVSIPSSINRVPRIQGNFIGTDVTGTARLGNTGNGVSVAQGNFTIIGGFQANGRNVISANGGAGVRLAGPATMASTVQSNFIGTDVSGTLNLGNNLDGVLISDCSSQAVGGLSVFSPAANRIAFNARDGIRVEGASATGNLFFYNSIFNNAGLGINLGSDGVTPNDAGDSDTGPNRSQNFPVLISAVANGTTTTVQGTFNARPNFDYLFHFFSNTTADTSGNGEGAAWIAEEVIRTDGSGNASFVVSLPTSIPPGEFITATATLSDPAATSGDRDGTSEFSNAQVVQGLGVSSPSQLLNISTRLRVQTGENVLIGGFIITGTETKKVIIRAIGPSLSQFFSGVLNDPTLELFQGNTLLDSNDNWVDRRAEIEATGIPPSNDLEASIVRTLAPGAYTAIVRGKNTSSGIGLVEAYDLDQAADSKLANISTRGFVETGNDVMIGGFIIGNSGGGGAKVVVRAIGPSLGAFGIAGALPDPVLDLVDAQGTVLRSNNDWKDSQQAEIEGIGLQPGNLLESVVVQTLVPGNYTAIVRGNGNTSGVGLVEVYNLR